MIDITLALFDRAWTPTLVTDSAAVVQEANPATARLTGRPAESLTGAPLHRLLPPKACTQLEARRTARPDGYADTITAVHRPDGRRVPVRAVTWPAGPPGTCVICCLFPLAAAPVPAQQAAVPNPPSLTAAETRIVEALAVGLTNVELGRELHLSRQGLDYHIDRLRRRFAARSRAALVARAYVTGLLDPATWPPRARAPHE
ncbi:LuxR C-terminal-related transcriptional regulator [Actinacidiphila acidipaludis]|uniref:PAS domain-containing protein n=1 Tax=Actinacidiphila acidipaludis TaxID=2873382 RepID=A0ABS7QHM1_9ACTN|nr:LuxR C-terminal-related transcriptional regulator [Streptomyces acidipaludis]MBY8882668.1 PAS domain-containing protein [Streptomyces acidipaludis]